jgi:hypothetical protein
MQARGRSEFATCVSACVSAISGARGLLSHIFVLVFGVASKEAFLPLLFLLVFFFCLLTLTFGLPVLLPCLAFSTL